MKIFEYIKEALSEVFAFILALIDDVMSSTQVEAIKWNNKSKI